MLSFWRNLKKLQVVRAITHGNRLLPLWVSDISVSKEMVMG